jgi:hypothetical protein
LLQVFSRLIHRQNRPDVFLGEYHFSFYLSSFNLGVLCILDLFYKLHRRDLFDAQPYNRDAVILSI